MIDLHSELEKLEKEQSTLKSHQVKVLMFQAASVITGILSLGESDISLGAACIAFMLTMLANKGVPKELEEVKRKIARISLKIQREKEYQEKQ